VADGLGFEDGDVARAAVLQRQRRAQAGVAAADDGDVGFDLAGGTLVP
jgi:hypothetical protein